MLDTMIGMSILLTVKLCFRHNAHIVYAEGFSYFISGYTIKLLDSLHDLTGLPWWFTIAVSTICLRGLITVPLAVYSSHIMARVEKLQPELKQMSKQLRAEIAHEVKVNNWTAPFATAQFRLNVSIII